MTESGSRHDGNELLFLPAAFRPAKANETWRNMLGWMILFALLTLPGAAAAVVGYPASLSLKSTSVIFAILFVVALLTRTIRRAR